MKMLIGGKKADSYDGKILEIFNPATGELIDTVPSAAKEDIEQCLDIAQKGKKIWAATPLHERSRILYKYVELLEEHFEELAEIQCNEMAKRIAECEGEIDYSIRAFKGFIEKYNHAYGDVLPDTLPWADQDIVFSKREPLGVIACIVPFNFPICLFVHKVAPALITGNAVIVKPSSDNPLMITRMVELLLESGVPGEVAQLITGRGSTIGKYLVPSSKIDAISLTGSTEAGIDVLRESSKHLHRVFLELGGNDAVIVLKDADLELAVSECIAGRVTNCGQICCASKRFLVHNSIKDEFTEMLVDGLSKMKIGNPVDRSTDISCLISEKAAIDVEKQVNHTVEQGARLVYGGERFNKTFYKPAVLVDVTPEMDIAQNLEIFGPVFPIIGFDTDNEAVIIANNTVYGLQGGIISANINNALKVASQIETGTVVINGSSDYRHPDHAFGGRKMSGIGSEGISTTLDEMTQNKTYVLKGALK